MWDGAASAFSSFILVVLRATDIGVAGGNGGLGVLRQGPPVEALFQHGFDTLVRTRPQEVCPSTGGFDPLRTVDFSPPHNASKATEPLVLVGPGNHNRF